MSKIVSLTPNKDRIAHLLQTSRQSAAIDRRTAVNINAAPGSNVNLHFHQHGDAPQDTPEYSTEDPEAEQARREFDAIMGNNSTARPVDPLAYFGARGARTAGKAHPAVRTIRRL